MAKHPAKSAAAGVRRGSSAFKSSKILLTASAAGVQPRNQKISGKRSRSRGR